MEMITKFNASFKMDIFAPLWAWAWLVAKKMGSAKRSKELSLNTPEALLKSKFTLENCVQCCLPGFHRLK